ncbi:vegetative cell wall protein gp1-like [Perca fluviatilis]|uniref:vegetative cell wall protein gp1-like n=1 Tax=Perca fluviatilis TaxID=8168 RepID=UPI0019643638|nr:vegetative cell wall protein gp1-like [Perca fluviatilis]
MRFMPGVTNTTTLADLRQMLDEDWNAVPQQCETPPHSTPPNAAASTPTTASNPANSQQQRSAPHRERHGKRGTETPGPTRPLPIIHAGTQPHPHTYRVHPSTPGHHAGTPQGAGPWTIGTPGSAAPCCPTAPGPRTRSPPPTPCRQGHPAQARCPHPPTPRSPPFPAQPQHPTHTPPPPPKERDSSPTTAATAP